MEPLALEATTTDEAREQIVKRGLHPCGYCLPWDEGLGHGRRFGEDAGRYVVRDSGSESEERPNEPWEIVDTETNEVVEAFEWRRHAGYAAQEWNDAVQRDPEMTPRRYEAKRRLHIARNRRRHGEQLWQDAIREARADGLSLREIAAEAGVVHSRIAAIIKAEADQGTVPPTRRDSKRLRELSSGSD